MTKSRRFRLFVGLTLSSLIVLFILLLKWADVRPVVDRFGVVQRNSSCKGRRRFTADFNISTDIPDLCSGETKLVIDIHVTADRRKERDIIRKTWLSDLRNNLSLRNIRYFFLLGQPGNDDIRQSVLQESRQYKDIVMYEFVDTYRNLTLKTVVALKWISSRCSNARFFFKTDDDVWVNVRHLMATVEKNKKELTYALGGVCRSVIVNRNSSNKWHASYCEMAQDKFDPYCSGTGYVGGIEVAKAISKVYKQVPYFHLEDVYVGMCLKALNYSTLFLKHFDNTGAPSTSNCNIKTKGLITSHKVPASRMERIYNAKCG